MHHHAHLSDPNTLIYTTLASKRTPKIKGDLVLLVFLFRTDKKKKKTQHAPLDRIPSSKKFAWGLDWIGLDWST